MLALVGRGEITPLRSLDTRDTAQVSLAEDIVFSPLAARLLTELTREVTAWSTGLGLTRTRVVSVESGGHEHAALGAAAAAHDSGHLGVFQVSEKRRIEMTQTPFFRMPVFVMWEAFTFHSDRNDWISVAATARQWLSRLTCSEILPAVSDNILRVGEPAQEYALIDSHGEEEYVRTETGGLVNASVWPSTMGPRLNRSDIGVELGNSYSLGPQAAGFAAAHSIGLDRLVGAMLARRPANLLEWTQEPIAVSGVRFEFPDDECDYRDLVEAAELTVIGTGQDEARLRDAMGDIAP